MKKKGILFSLIVMLLLLNLLALKTANTSSKKALAGNSVEALAINSIEEQFDDIKMNAVRFSGFGSAEEVKERVLPFSFEFDGNSFTAQQEIPLRADRLRVFFDATNSFEVLLEDTDYDNNFFTGIVVDVNTPKNNLWSGTETGAKFHILPQCLAYEVFDINHAGFTPQANCEAAFTFGGLQRYDVNVFLQGDANFNSVSCSFDSNTICPKNDYDSFSLNPFMELNILDQNCTNCSIPAEVKTIKGHFNPAAQNTVAISCIGAGCQTPDFNITFSGGPQAIFNGPIRQSISMQATFRSAPEELEFFDFNFSMRHPLFGLAKRIR